MEEKRKTKLIYSQRLAGHLMQCGFRLVDLMPNSQKPEKNVFVFFDSDMLSNAMSKWQSHC